jgi:hypothetical protein
MPQTRRQKCPACLADPTLIKICAICHGKGEVTCVEIAPSVWEITPLGETKVTFTGAGPEVFPVKSSDEPPKRISLHDGWAEFERLALPDEASNLQRKEMRRAWYAGVGWFLTSLASSLSDGTEETDDDMAYMESIEQELQTFGRQILMGHA